MNFRLSKISQAIVATLLFCITLMTAVLLSAQQPPSIQALYIFGDSLSDTGNVYRATNGTYPPSPPYFQGRFSNGQVWVEYLTQQLSIDQVNNFAIGGATTASTGGLSPQEDRANPSANRVPGLLSQVQSFTQTVRNSQSGRLNSDALYVLWAGANDYLQGTIDPAVPVENITQAITLLIAEGTNKILVVNLPDLGQLPATLNTANSEILSRLTEAHNRNLRRSFTQINQQNPDLQLVLLNVQHLYQTAIAQPSTYGFTNVTQSCAANVQLCRIPDQFLFWDTIHPTTAGHEIIAEQAFAALQEKLLMPAMTQRSRG